MPPIIEQFLSLDPIYLTVLGIMVLVSIMQLYYYFRYFAAPLRLKKKLNKGLKEQAKELKPVSVVICSKNEAEHLREFLPSILGQDYPTFEVIVVNDGSTDDSNIMLEELAQKHSNLKITFLPQKAKYMSRKKMCISIAIKAARYDHIVLTDADCKPDSKNWLTSIMQCYTPETEIVLGYTRFEKMSNFEDYDNLFFTMQYLGYAICGNPFKGTIRNMSYLKGTYTHAGGYTKYLNMETGEDDIFIQDTATPRNTKVAIAEGGSMTCAREINSKVYRLMKEQRLENYSRYKFGFRFSTFMQRLSMYLFYILSIACMALFAIIPDWIGFGIAVFFFLFRMITQQVVFSKIANLLQMRKHQAGAIFFEIVMPVYEFHLRTFGRIGRKRWEMWKA